MRTAHYRAVPPGRDYFRSLSCEIDRYFLLNEKGEKVSSQTGVVRTNCIDCLDRTNVTQLDVIWFPRYGKRTAQGIVKDGWNALARYYLNNFVDGTKQVVTQL
ncbi:hypothetical protein BHM03_00031667 [Ensete ventricosum]|nr:hypothetical protein BHM03_00031667 [Ensete ventricosum]